MISVRKLKKIEKNILKTEQLRNTKFIATHYLNKVDRYRSVILVRAIILCYLLFIPVNVFFPFFRKLLDLNISIDMNIIPLILLPVCFVVSYLLQFIFGGLFITKKNKLNRFLQYSSRLSDSTKSDPCPKVVIVISRFEERGVVIPKGMLQELVPHARWEAWTERLNKSIKIGEISKELPNLFKDIDELISLHLSKDEETNSQEIKIES